MGYLRSMRSKIAIFDLSSPSYTFPSFWMNPPKVIKMKYIFL